MKILPITNIQNNRQQNFKAKFSASDIAGILSEVRGKDASFYPKIYTILTRMSELPGKTAKFVLSTGGWQVHVDNKSLSHCYKYATKYDALEKSIVYKDSCECKFINSDIVRMPESVFEQKWWANRFAGEKDIKAFSLTV